ncbi:MAG: hypothetical protein JRF64_01265 [Deltaproteobacteria bacterium]|jgi:hypothetical protein|nr:hypothetical protein [Deltaproteobacteria bacterium]MBW2565546.1 hypothetical protein [Deltaproteobacteria bacterium]
MEDQRKQRAFRSPTRAFVAIGPSFDKVGPLKDLSIAGLAFHYIGSDTATDGSYVVIFLPDGDYYSGEIPFETMSDVETVEEESFSYLTTWRCCVKFGELTLQQKARIEQFIQDHHTVGEA